MTNKNKEIPLQVPADLKKIETMSQGKLKMTFITQEGVNPDVRSRMMGMHDLFGWLSFMPGENNLQAEDLVNLPKVVKHEEDSKTPSQRLRAVLFVLWEQSGRPNDSFDAYYRSAMNRLVDHYKEKLT